MAYTSILEYNGTHSLSFSCGAAPADLPVMQAGHEPNGYFWTGVATLLAPELVARLNLDPEAGMFSASGALTDVQQLQAVLEPVLADPDAARTMLTRAEQESFAFDD